MALQATAYGDGYAYCEDIITMNEENIAKSISLFKHYKQSGVIVEGEYDDLLWIISNGVTKAATLNFEINEVYFEREMAKKLNCSALQYQQAMRLVITSRFGYSIHTLQSDTAVMRNFANRQEIPKDYFTAHLLGDFLSLLPNESPYRSNVQNTIDDISLLHHSGPQQRKLAHYQSYLRFSDILSDFWETASEDEHILYFPLWYWFVITGVLPLRPTECVLTPRNCISKDCDNNYHITVRRSRSKGKRQSLKYKIDSDYELAKYPIPEHLAKTIQEYISSTQRVYESDIDVLYCKTSQHFHLTGSLDNNHHYTYSNLRECLSFFYRDVVEGKYGYRLVSDQNTLLPGEINRIHLGDTRHIAMISLAVSGGSPTICKALAGHDSIQISSHYYANLTSFLDVLGYERFREMKSNKATAYGLQINTMYPVAQGYCQCEQVWTGDYSACADAVNSDGLPGACPVCKWYMPKGTSLSIKLPITDSDLVNTPKNCISLELQQTCILLRQAIDMLRHGLGNTETVSCVLDRLAAQSQQYVHSAAIEHLISDKEGAINA